MPDMDFSIIRFSLSAGGLVFFLGLELVIPYRSSTVSKTKRWVTNITLTIFNTLILNALYSFMIIATLSYATANRTGVLYLHDLPYWVRVTATILFMDFMLYIWHLLNHEMPLLWRFHRVHHSDLNMDVSTATRFHIGELFISLILKTSFIFFLGADILSLVIFESVLLLTAQFQHSSLKVPVWFETIYWFLFVPPSMHRIHHSVIIKERNTNYGTIFSIWDRIFGTLLARINQKRICIGVGAYPKPENLKLHRLLIMPFTKPIK